MKYLFLVLLFISSSLFSQKVIEGKSKPVAIDYKGRAKKSSAGMFNNIKRWAVVIGISDYKFAGKDITPLRYADDDAISFFNFLRSAKGGGFEDNTTKLLINQDATLSNIRDAINDFLGNAIEDDIVIIYFAGHGSPDPKNPKNLFLLTYDTDPKKMSSTGYLMKDMETALNNFIKARNVIVFADACHSAGVSDGMTTRGTTDEGLINRYLLELAASDDSRLIFTASEKNELSQEDIKWGGGHGIFTWSLLEGMEGKADYNLDGLVTLGELLDYTDNNVKRETKSNQHPSRSATSYDRDLPISIITPLGGDKK